MISGRLKKAFFVHNLLDSNQQIVISDGCHNKGPIPTQRDLKMLLCAVATTMALSSRDKTAINVTIDRWAEEAMRGGRE